MEATSGKRGGAASSSSGVRGMDIEVRDLHDGSDGSDSAPATEGAMTASERRSAKKRSKLLTEPNTKMVQKRLQEFGREHCLAQSPTGHLICKACNFVLEPSSTAVKRHIETEKHKNNVAKTARRVGECSNVQEFVREWRNMTGFEDARQDQQLAMQLLTAQTCLVSGMPLHKLRYFTRVLDNSLTSSAGQEQMEGLVPALLQMEITRVNDELSSADHIVLVCDGARNMPESLDGAAAVVARWYDEGFEVRERLLHLQFGPKVPAADYHAKPMVDYALRRFAFDSRRVTAVLNAWGKDDRPSVTESCPRAFQMDCLDSLLREHCTWLKVPLAESFISSLHHCCSVQRVCYWAWNDSCEARLPALGDECLGFPQSYDWFVAVYDGWEGIPRFLAHPDTEDCPRASRMRAIWADPQQRSFLKLELAVGRYMMQGILQAISTLEGDGPLAFICFDVLGAVRIELEELFPAIMYEPVQNEIRQLAEAATPTLSMEDALALYTAIAKQAVEGVVQIIKDRLFDARARQVEVYRAARLCNPLRLAELRPPAQAVREMLVAVQPIMPQLDVAALMTEFPQYMQFVRDMYVDEEASSIEGQLARIVAFWKTKTHRLPAWHSFARQVAAMQPSPSSTARVFSLMRQSFRDPDHGASDEFIQASIMYQFHGRDVEKLN